MEKVQWNYTDTKQQLPNDGPWVTLNQGNLSASIHSNSQAKAVHAASEFAGQGPLNLKMWSVPHLYKNPFYKKMVISDVIKPIQWNNSNT